MTLKLLQIIREYSKVSEYKSVYIHITDLLMHKHQLEESVQAFNGSRKGVSLFKRETSFTAVMPASKTVDILEAQ